MRILILTGILLTTPSLPANEDWHLWKDNSEVKVYLKPSSNGTIEVRATTQVMTSLSALIALLHDTEHVPEWTESVTSVTIVEEIGQRGNIVHTQFKAPWPVANRDMVTFSEFSQPTPCSLVLDITDRHDALPEFPGYIRMLEVKTRWTLAAQADGMIAIDYQAHADVAGSLPQWLANRVSLNATFKTFQALRHEIGQDRYRTLSVDGISDCPEGNHNQLNAEAAQP